MAPARWERIAPLFGIATVVLWVVGVVVSETAGNLPDDTPQDILRYFEEDEYAIYIGGVLLFLGAMALIWFVGGLRSRVAAAEGATPRLAPVLFGTGVAIAVLSMASYAPQISGALGANETDEALLPEAAQALWVAGDGFFVAAEFALGAFLLATAVAALSTGVLPRWLAWVSVLLAVVAFVPPIGWAVVIFAFPLWLLVTSVLLLRRAPATERPEPAAPPPP